jgi:hypothetical protein
VLGFILDFGRGFVKGLGLDLPEIENLFQNVAILILEQKCQRGKTLKVQYAKTFKIHQLSL